MFKVRAIIPSLIISKLVEPSPCNHLSLVKIAYKQMA